MKKILLLLSLAFVLSSCELLPQNSDITTAETTAENAIVTTFPASTAFVPDGDTALSERYEGEGYVACRFSDEDGENIYFAVHLDNGQSIRIDRDERVSVLPSLYEMVHFSDINFDGINDLCISMGGFGVQGAAGFKGYISVDGKYELCKGFDEIPNPVIDTEHKLILGTNRENTSEHTYYKYTVNGFKVNKLETVTYNVVEDTVEKYGNIYPASEFADWEFDSVKWSNIIGRTPKKEYLAKTTPYYIS